MFLVLFSLYTLLVKGDELGKKNYMNSDSFYGLEEDFINKLMKYELYPINFKEAEDQLTVSTEEVDYYRNYYGTLQEQIDNIKEQYNLDSEELSEEIKAERDAKITEIRKNFESEEVVRNKILEAKRAALKDYEKDYEQERQAFRESYNYFSYSLKDLDDGRTYQFGKFADLVYSNEYTAQEPLSAYVYHSASLHEYEPDMIGLMSVDLIDEQTEKMFTGKIGISKANIVGSGFASDIKYYNIQFYIVLIVLLAGVVALLLLIGIVRPRLGDFIGKFERLELSFNKWPIDIRLAIVAISGFLMIFEVDNMPFLVDRITYLFTNPSVEYGSTIVDIVIRSIYSFVIFSVLVLASVWTYIALQNDKGLYEQSIIYRIVDALREAFLNRSIGTQTVLLFGVFFATGVTFSLAFMSGFFMLVFLLLFFFAFFPALYMFVRRAGYLSRIMKQTEEMATGRTTTPIKVKGKSQIAEHARNLNALREGVEFSMREQAKSERLKTELITNVSHDLRTPLTSIITYTDLLKNPDLSPEEREKYVQIVDRKAERLKTLIEDLFEVSKMASGNIEIHKTKIDLALMLQQIAAEHEEDYAKRHLDLRLMIEDQPIFAHADGQKWWRVYDNLLVNARKYSLANTRVYASLKMDGAYAVFSIKNIASYELNESASELVERFKRADQSRHTEGSGLGLAIAQSIVDLHGGQLLIEVDGDLFKVTVKLPI